MKRHKTFTSAVALTLVLGATVTVAAVHKGYPAEDVSLQTRDVWVTNGKDLLAGRLNHQINQLDTSVATASGDIDVLQNGDGYFLLDHRDNTIENISQAYSTLSGRISIPAQAKVAYGDHTLAVLSPEGKFWVLDASGKIAFDPTKTPPTAQVGAGAEVAVSESGVAYAVSATKHQLVTVSSPTSTPSTSSFSVTAPFQLTTVGNTPVVLGNAGRSIQVPGGATVRLPEQGLQLQQSGAANGSVLVASGDALLEVPLNGGTVRSISAGGRAGLTDPAGVSAPVWLDGCAYGAWAGISRYLYACTGANPQGVTIDQSVTGDELTFRVNHGVIALNDVDNGNAWVPSSRLLLVDNWKTVVPNAQQVQSQDGQQQPVTQSYTDTLAHRTTVNHPPIAVPHTYGVRPGRTTVLPVIQGCSDPDGDYLTVAAVSAIPASQGTLQIIEGGREVQLTPAPGASGGISFSYTISDGRGGTATATVLATIYPDDVHKAPVSTAVSTTNVEAGQSTSYYVLNDWISPVGDDLTLTSASTTSGDKVSFTPNGMVTYNNTTNAIGLKTVNVTVSDGTTTSKGTLTVDVHPDGTLPPVSVPYYATAEPGQRITIDPLSVDQSPSGEPLTLVGASQFTGPTATLSTDSTTGTIQFTGNQVGSYYLNYTLGAGSQTVPGVIRVDVVAPTKDAPPIAVADVAYVRPGQPTTIDALANDVSPSGKILVVQSVTAGADAVSQSLDVQVLDNQYVKISSPTALPQQVQLTYTISDGVHSASAGIVVIPSPLPVTPQPPVAVNDTAKVRAGDYISVPVLENDYSPDGEPFSLEPKLASTSQAGPGALAFVSGDMVRYQAPTTPGQYSVTYKIVDSYGQTSTAMVTFTVVAVTKATDQAPTPQTLTVRSFSGAQVPITVPVDGISPSGASVSFTGISSQPKLGQITATTSTSFTYESYPGATGTDTFTYTVMDSLGKTATGTVQVGLVPRPTSALPPVAVQDTVQVKPGKQAAVQPLLNDSDPSGYPITLQKKLVAQGGVKASEYGSMVIVRAPSTLGTYLVQYSISNGHGGQASSSIIVDVVNNPTPVYPTAVDHVIESAAGKSVVTVNATDGAFNPSGFPNDLKVSVPSSESKNAQVSGDQITIALGSERSTYLYTVTDPQSGLSGSAFIVVPPKRIDSSHHSRSAANSPPPTSKATKSPSPSSTPKATTTSTPTATPKAPQTTQPPHIKDGLAQLYVSENGTKSWNFGDLVTVPSGRPAMFVNPVSAQGGTVTLNSAQELTFTAKNGYRGQASISFSVDDGKEPGATSDRITPLTYQFTVGESNQSDVPPQFTTEVARVGAGDSMQVDLRAQTVQPNPQTLAAIQYSDLKYSSSNFTAALSGSTLTITAPLTAKPATEVVPVTFTMTSGQNVVTGTENVLIVSSTKPLPQQVGKEAFTQRRNSTQTYSVLSTTGASTTYWTNPFAPKPLTLVSMTATQLNGVTVTSSQSAGTISVAAGGDSDTGQITISYKVQDATGDPTRIVTGTATVYISDVPSPPAAPTITNSSSGSVSINFDAATSNGYNVTEYKIAAVTGGRTIAKTVTQSDSGPATIQGLTNGTSYQFEVSGYNQDGWGAYSTLSAARTPYGTPGAPNSVGVSDSTSGGYAPSTVTLSWSAPSTTGGGSLSYQYQWFVNGVPQGWHSVGGSISVSIAGQGQASFYGQVRATNNGSGVTGPAGQSNTLNTPGNPPASVSLSRGGSEFTYSGPYGSCTYGCFNFDVTVSHFPANSSFPITFYCDGQMDWQESVSTDGNGNGNYNGANHSPRYMQPFCGYNGAYVIVNGLKGGPTNFNPN